MNVIEINTVDYGSTGNIMLQIAENAEKEGVSVYTISSKWCGCKSRCKNKRRIKHFYLNDFVSNLIHRQLGTFTGLDGFFSFFHTFFMIRQMMKNKPEVLHIHNLHGYYINWPLLFLYIKYAHIPVIWTLHDCWALTGRCPHFTMTKCEKWKKECHDCPYPKYCFPQSKIDTTRMLWNLKYKCFTGIDNCILVTPSQWLADIVKQSFLNSYPVKVINNGIDLSVFKPTESDFRNRYELVDKKIVLGVAFGWDKSKGLDVFIELSNRLPENYRIVLVGTDNRIDAILPSNIISIHRTHNQKELVEIYTSADVFVNPTRADTYPTVNMESLACGTPVVTFDIGGSPEIIDKTCGSVVPCDDLESMKNEIRRVCDEKPYSQDACLSKAKYFDMNAKFKEYIDLYKNFLV